VRKLREKGTTIILTTHYIEEAEEMADRVGVIDHGRVLLVEEKAALMRKLGKRRLTLALQEPMEAVPAALAAWPLTLEQDGSQLVYTFDAEAEDTGMPSLLRRMGELGIDYRDLDTSRSSLEDIFVTLVERPA
jgi:ABC-2 type transport system ATP-binding protein